MKSTDERILQIESKLDFIVKELELQKKRREEFEELKTDINRVLKSLFNTIIEEMDDVSENLTTGSFIFFGKKIIRNLNNLGNIIDQLESVEDFIKDFSPLLKRISIDTMNKLEEFEKKGYFKFINNLLQLFDKVLLNFKEEDMKIIINSIEPVFLIMRETLTDKNLNLIRKFIDNLKETENKNVSTFKIIKELNSKEVKIILYKILKSYKKTIIKED